MYKQTTLISIVFYPIVDVQHSFYKNQNIKKSSEQFIWQFYYKIISENVPKLTDTANLVNELCKISSLNIALAKS